MAWLFRPFGRIAGGQALGWGLAVLVATAALASRNGLHTDGVLDLHLGPPAALWVLLAQGAINWLSLASLLWLAGRWLSHGRFRTIDLFGTQALARWPMLLAAAWLSVPWVRHDMEARTARLLAALPTPPNAAETAGSAVPAAFALDAIWLVVLSLPGLVAVVWMVWLMYHGFALVTHMRGARAVLGFIGALIAAEILSKVLIVALLRSLV